MRCRIESAGPHEPAPTLLDLVAAVHTLAESDCHAVRIVRWLLASGLVRRAPGPRELRPGSPP